MTDVSMCAAPGVKRRPAGAITAPPQPLRGGRAFAWSSQDPSVRIFHYSPHVPAATTRRPVGPRDGRFDPHSPQGSTADERAVLYLAESLATAACEVLVASAARNSAHGSWVVSVCPARYAAWIAPTTTTTLQELVDESPQTIGAPDDLGDGAWDRRDTQRWARAIHEDRPAHPAVAGIRYWSARHHRPDGGRAGINRVVWETAPELEVDPDPQGEPSLGVPLRHPALWPRIVSLLRRAHIGVEQIDSGACGRCS